MGAGASAGALRAREERRTVVLQARLRGERGWGDACILNLSSRGLLVYSTTTVRPGNFVELCRGEQVIVARVVWRNSRRIGLCAREPLAIEAVISGGRSLLAFGPGTGKIELERRRRQREPGKARLLGRFIEFAAVVAVGSLLAGAAYATVVETLQAPLATVSEILRRG
jgi:hypothetical protein